MADTASTPTPGDSPAANSTPAPTPTVQGENSNGTAPTPFSLTERNAPLTTPYAFPPNCPAWTALDISGSLGARHDVYAGYAGPSNNIVNHARGYHELYCLPSIADSWYEEYEWPSNAASDAFGEGFGYLDGVGGRYERNGTKGAVCPAEWVARDVGVSSYLTSVGSGIGREMSTITFSTAFCCPRFVSS